LNEKQRWKEATPNGGTTMVISVRSLQSKMTKMMTGIITHNSLQVQRPLRPGRGCGRASQAEDEEGNADEIANTIHNKGNTR